MNQHKISDKQKITNLETENKALKARLKKATNQKSEKYINFRKLGIVFVAGFAGAMLMVGNLVFWTGRTLTDNQRYIEATQPLIENQAIQEAIANKATSAIFQNLNIQQIVERALPESALFLAPTISSQVQSYANTQAKNIVSSQQFKQVWQTVNARAHERLLNAVRNYQGDGTFDINDLYERISAHLQDGRLSFLANRTLPAKVGSITIISTPNLPKAHWIVVNLWWIRLVSIALFVLLTWLVIWLAKNRRKAMMRISWLYALLMLVTLLALRFTKTFMVSKIDVEYQSAAMAVWDIVLKSLLQQTVALLLAFVCIAIIAWLTGPSQQMKLVRSKISSVLNGRLHATIFSKENKFTIWLGNYKQVVKIFVLVIAGFSLLVIRLIPINILIVVAILGLVIIIIEALSAVKKR